MRTTTKDILLACLLPACLIGLIALDRRHAQEACTVALGFERGRQELLKTPHAVDVDNYDARWRSECSFTLVASVAIADGAPGYVRREAVDLEYDTGSRRWKASGARPYR
jgi:hypothetical protein